ncbi:MAG: hypothetical protein GHCLOJNM_03481 [bacterium]|nr:hypothetical protein [bacterium]
MKDEVRVWLTYAEENLHSAEILLESGLLNPSLQNSQQSIEKNLKALLLAFDLPLKRIHGIEDLCRILEKKGVQIDLTVEERELLDSVYLPSKYPTFSVLPDFIPDTEICMACLNLARKVQRQTTQILK